MATETNAPKLTVREIAVVTKDEALCTTAEDASMFLLRVLNLNGGHAECIPMECSSGKSISFVTAVDGLGYTLTYKTSDVGLGDGASDFVRIVDANIERNEAFDCEPRNYRKYRITFYESAEVRLDPFEFAWLLSKYQIEVTAKADLREPRLFVRARNRSQLLNFANAVNHSAGPLIFKSIAGGGCYGYEEIEF